MSLEQDLQSISVSATKVVAGQAVTRWSVTGWEVGTMGKIVPTSLAETAKILRNMNLDSEGFWDVDDEADDLWLEMMQARRPHNK